MYKLKPGGRSEKINPRWDYGIFVGVRRRSNELYIATQDWVVQSSRLRDSQWKCGGVVIQLTGSAGLRGIGTAMRRTRMGAYRKGSQLRKGSQKGRGSLRQAIS